jgi:hypothetical protein
MPNCLLTYLPAYKYTGILSPLSITKHLQHYTTSNRYTDRRF